MVEPERDSGAPGNVEAGPSRLGSGDRILPPRMRLYLYFAAGVVFTLWLSLEILGAAGFVAFVIAMLCWQAAFHVRPTINAAFVAALIGYALTIAIWSVAFGPPQPGQHAPTTTSVPAQ